MYILEYTAVYPDAGETEGRGRSQGLEHVIWARREAEVTRVSTRGDVVKRQPDNRGC